MRRIDGSGAAALAAALTLYTAFNAGGYFADSVGWVAAALLVLLALRTAIVERPFAGLGRRALLAAAGLALLTAWSIVSLVWSHSPGRALLEADRVVLYLLVLVVFAASPWSAGRLRGVIVGVAAASVVVAVAALLSRLLPDVVHTAPNIEPGRLSFPITYWNALALLAAIGLVLCAELATTAWVPRLGRSVAVAALPALAVTLLLTYSRGGVAVAVLMLLVWAALARPRGLVGLLLAAGPASAVAVVVGYRASELASSNPASAAAATQGHRVAAVTVAAMVVAAAAHAVLAKRSFGVAVATTKERFTGFRRLATRRTRIAVAASAALVVAAGIAAAAVHQIRRFDAKPSASTLTDTRNRLTDPSSNGRVQYWRVALDSFADEPLHGTGAGTYQLQWWQRRTVPQSVSQAHSLYFQTLGELGVPGLLLLLVGLAPLLAALTRPLRSPERATVAALVACAAGWALHAALDWDWQIPTVTIWLFAAGGVALARRAPDPAARRQPLRLAPRAAMSVAFLVAAGLPALAAVSQTKLDDALNAYNRGDCGAAIDAARAAHAALPARAEPRLVRAWCEARAHRFAAAARDAGAAERRDPDDWESHYSLAVIDAAAGTDPRAEAAAALHLDPLEPAAQQLAADLAGTNDPQERKRRAFPARLYLHGLDYPALGG